MPTRVVLIGSALVLVFATSLVATYAASDGVNVQVEVIDPSAPPPPPPPSGGGGGGTIVVATTSITIAGRAYPLSNVTVLRDGTIAARTIAGPDALFNVSLTGLQSGSYAISVYGEDESGRRSTLFTFPITVTVGATTAISGVFISPTIDVGKSEVRRGDIIPIFGQTAPQGEVTIMVHSDSELMLKTRSADDGGYLYNLNSSLLELGDHTTQSRTQIAATYSLMSQLVNFTVGTKNVSKKTGPRACKGDVNGDGRINLVDFSIMAYWYHRGTPPVRVDLNGDGVITLVDFSIMAYCWTG